MYHDVIVWRSAGPPGKFGVAAKEQLLPLPLLAPALISHTQAVLRSNLLQEESIGNRKWLVEDLDIF